MLIEMAERRIVPDRLVRIGIRRLLSERLREAQQQARTADRMASFQQQFAEGPVAVETSAANRQHYEVPADFFQAMLGSRLKYSSCYWADQCHNLDEAEEEMLQLTCDRAEILDGQSILELGCGWGSLTLWMAEHFPTASILAVSNSRSQQEFILQQCRQRELHNVEVKVYNVAELRFERQFDRVVSVEMFEHMHNWTELLERVSTWMLPHAKCFLHFFCHREYFYPFQSRGRSDWMAKHFFTGGVMPSHDVLHHLNTPLKVEANWSVNGNHYAKTCRCWLENLDAAADSMLDPFTRDLGLSGAKRQLNRWRMFTMACEELFAYDAGNEWFVNHSLLSHR